VNDKYISQSAKRDLSANFLLKISKLINRPEQNHFNSFELNEFDFALRTLVKVVGASEN
jgi:hypothetical protein